MNYKELADLLYPDVTMSIDDLEKKYPKRDLPDHSEVCRFAPSPTGRMHLGNLFASFMPEVFAHQSNGVFILRIEDTDDKRAIENGINLIFNDLRAYNYQIDESPLTGGEYGPYIQTQRKDIYKVCAKYLVSIGRAYPCFCSEEDLNVMREKQEKCKERIGYYGKYAKCRNLSIEEVKKHLDNGDKFVLRLKSMGDFEKKIVYTDLVKGRLELPENDIDQVLVKSDGIPPYAFAHVVDDHFMRVTVVTRDDSYISSVPYHFEIWDAMGFTKPRFAHLLPLNIKDGETVRKISKRKDPEAAVAFYHERGIPVEAIKLYFATLLNSNFEEWYIANPNKSYRDFHFDFSKMSKSGPLFDMEKLINISRNYLSRISAPVLYENLKKWASEFDKEFYDIIDKYKEYTINILNIEREQDKPRKDFSCYSDIKNYIWYMFNEYFDSAEREYEFKNITDRALIKEILKEYIDNYYDASDDKDTWFNKIKELAVKFGFASNMKEYKNNPEAFKGNITDIATVIRVGVTTRSMTPDLYDILGLLGKEEINRRIDMIN